MTKKIQSWTRPAAGTLLGGQNAAARAKGNCLPVSPINHFSTDILITRHLQAMAHPLLQAFESRDWTFPAKSKR
jgi:hypothetical protein